mmetsp:Transcript_65130/g.182121  ORF Transcript_65130/g.182121 Transcript_65130/m.182121 type:complete len:270 (-) Transcript_65130:866-1675(-)
MYSQCLRGRRSASDPRAAAAGRDLVVHRRSLGARPGPASVCLPVHRHAALLAGSLATPGCGLLPGEDSWRRPDVGRRQAVVEHSEDILAAPLRHGCADRPALPRHSGVGSPCCEAGGRSERVPALRGRAAAFGQVHDSAAPVLARVLRYLRRAVGFSSASAAGRLHSRVVLLQPARFRRCDRRRVRKAQRGHGGVGLARCHGHMRWEDARGSHGRPLRRRLLPGIIPPRQLGAGVSRRARWLAALAGAAPDARGPPQQERQGSRDRLAP